MFYLQPMERQRKSATIFKQPTLNTFFQCETKNDGFETASGQDTLCSLFSRI